MIRRCIALIDQPEARKSAASQSSSSGWVGGVPRRPKSEGVGTIGLPKWCCQIRLTITRAARSRGGPSVSQRARASRPLPVGGQVDRPVGLEHLGNASGHHVAELVRVAADLQLHVGRLSVADGVGLRGHGHRPGRL